MDRQGHRHPGRVGREINYKSISFCSQDNDSDDKDVEMVSDKEGCVLKRDKVKEEIEVDADPPMYLAEGDDVKEEPEDDEEEEEIYEEFDWSSDDDLGGNNPYEGSTSDSDNETLAKLKKKIRPYQRRKHQGGSIRFEHGAVLEIAPGKVLKQMSDSPLSLSEALDLLQRKSSTKKAEKKSLIHKLEGQTTVAQKKKLVKQLLSNKSVSLVVKKPGEDDDDEEVEDEEDEDEDVTDRVLASSNKTFQIVVDKNNKLKVMEKSPMKAFEVIKDENNQWRLIEKNVERKENIDLSNLPDVTITRKQHEDDEEGDDSHDVLLPEEMLELLTEKDHRLVEEIQSALTENQKIEKLEMLQRELSRKPPKPVKRPRGRPRKDGSMPISRKGNDGVTLDHAGLCIKRSKPRRLQECEDPNLCSPVDGTQNVLCLSCKSVLLKSSFNQHYRQIHRELPDTMGICHVCGGEYRIGPIMKRHMLSHTEEGKQYECQYCKKMFHLKYHLRRHMRMHTGERPYICPLCGKSYKQLGHLKFHDEHVHKNGGLPEERPYQCMKCMKSFKLLGKLKRHEASAHGSGPPVGNIQKRRIVFPKVAVPVRKRKVLMMEWQEVPESDISASEEVIETEHGTFARTYRVAYQ